MQCEICGRESGRLVRIALDGSHLAVCGECSSYGSIEAQGRALPETPAQKTKMPAAHETKSILEIEDDIAAGYGKTVRHAREMQGLTIEEFGKKVFEKASFLHRIEAETVKPSPGLAKKLENALGIKITGKGNE